MLRNWKLKSYLALILDKKWKAILYKQSINMIDTCFSLLLPICIATFAFIYIARLKIELETECARNKADAARLKIELETERARNKADAARLKIELELETEHSLKKADASRVNSLEIELETERARNKAYVARLKIETERAEALEKQLRYELSSMTAEQWNSLNDHDRRLNEDLCKQYGIPFPNIQESFLDSAIPLSCAHGDTCRLKQTSA